MNRLELPKRCLPRPIGNSTGRYFRLLSAEKVQLSLPSIFHDSILYIFRNTSKHLVLTQTDLFFGCSFFAMLKVSFLALPRFLQHCLILRRAIYFCLSCNVRPQISKGLISADTAAPKSGRGTVFDDRPFPVSPRVAQPAHAGHQLVPRAAGTSFCFELQLSLAAAVITR